MRQSGLAPTMPSLALFQSVVHALQLADDRADDRSQQRNVLLTTAKKLFGVSEAQYKRVIKQLGNVCAAHACVRARARRVCISVARPELV